MSLSEQGLKTLKPSEIEEAEDNLNLHEDRTLDHIEASIRRFGFLDPIGVVEKPDGGYVAVEGNGRLKVAKSMKLKSVPVLVLSLEEAERRGYAIAHNQIQQVNDMDRAAVSAEFQRLGVTEEDYASIGYSEEDVLFLPGIGDAFSAPDGGEYQEQEGEAASIGSDRRSFSSFMPTVHKSALRFTNDLSYDRFVEFLGLMAERFPNAVTIGERLQCALTQMGMPEATQEEEVA